MAVQARTAEPPRITTPLTTKLAYSLRLSPKEIAILAGLQKPIQIIRRGREIIAQGQQCNDLFVLLEGTAIRYSVAHDGRRQIFNIVLPGDFIGFPACFFETALFSIGALTDAHVSAVPLSELLALFERHGRLAAILLWQFSCEAAMYAEHLIELGRRSAIERVAHLLLELLTRLQAIGLAKGSSYSMPLTQQVIADVLGLSPAHVNRSLRQLRDEGLVTIAGRTVVINDFHALAALTHFEKSYINRFHINEVLSSRPTGAF
jgi:CRP-like cAMP-binding protein